MIEISEMLWHMAEEGITRLGEYILECICYIRPENPLDDCAPQGGLENTLFTKAIKKYASEKTSTLLSYSSKGQS